MSSERHRPRITPFCAALCVVLLAQCGKKGPPLPPQRFIPVETRDLSIHQQGNELIFRLTYPSTTTGGAPLPGLEAVEIWELVAETSEEGTTPTPIEPEVFSRAASRLLTLQGPELRSAVVGDQIQPRIPLRDPLPEERELHVFAVRSRSTTGEVSSFSNTAQIVLRPAIPPPHDLSATARRNGIELSWLDDGGEEVVGYHVYRRAAEERGYGEPLTRLERTETSFLDDGALFGRRYIYTVRSLASTDPLIESAPAGEQEIDYQDRFPPSPPRGLLALAEAGRVRLVWEASRDEDTVGYVLERRDPGADWRRITEEPVSELELLDEGLVPGLTYEYRALAVDAAGNEGEPGPVARATVQ